MRNPKLPSRGRGFSTLEILIVVAILGIVALIVGTQASRTMRLSSLSSAVENVRGLVQSAQNEMKFRGQVTFVELSYFTPVATTLIPSPQPRWRARLFVDADGNGALDTAADTLLRTVEFPPEISLSTASSTQAASVNWSVNTADTATRLLTCDLLSRATVPGPTPPAGQIQGFATLDVTHRDMVPATGAVRLTPPTRYQVRVAPVWSVSVQRAVYAGGTWRNT